VIVDLGRPHRHFRVTDSTNERAKELAMDGVPGGLVVTADEQTAGRGRRGNAWFAPPGSCLLYSALVRPFAADRSPLLPLAVPVAVCEAAEAVAPVRCQVKWPNDIWIDERKVSGVLVEARPDEGWAVVGVGLNVAITEEQFPPGVPRALTALNEALGEWLEADDDEVLSAYRARDALIGRRVSWEDGEGVAEEIDERGHLVVEKANEERVALGAGEVHLAIER
jgi:BirA family biotin operon repressor/biotin-[acetyl-CoA-carboxylase] ligase